MIKYNVRGENIEVTPAIREYVEAKVGKVEKYFDEMPPNTQAHVNLKMYPDRDGKAEVTIPLPDLVLRAEETSPDLYGSIDLIADKLERQVRKYKTKVNRKFRRQKAEMKYKVSPELVKATSSDNDEEEEEEINIVRQKRFNLKPMHAEEAVLQMEMLGHDFFIYLDGETGETNIVYKRDDDDYGLIETNQIEP
ncbi:MAG: ribosome-associated translation inhibitor RaiA [Atopostipes sp.]|nr:ribosome-associated translation inhibitor RaiA [Atopostipes sp.]